MVAVTAEILGILKQTLENWVRLAHKCQLKGAGNKLVSPKQMELARLRAENARLRMKCDVLRKAMAYFCAGIKVKYVWIANNKKRRAVSLACDLLDVSASGFFEYMRRKGADKSPKPVANMRLSNKALLVHIRAIHAEVQQKYGWPKMCKELVARGIRVGKDRVQRIMKKHGIKARGKKKFFVTEDIKHNLPIAPNLLQRNFTAEAPN